MSRIRTVSLVAYVLMLSALSLAAVQPSQILGDSKRLAAAIDRVVTNRMARDHVPGAVVSVVHGRKVVFKKGYGFANVEERRPVHPDKPLFRVASVSKVFNAKAESDLRSPPHKHGDTLPKVRPMRATARSASQSISNQTSGQMLIVHCAIVCKL